MFQICRVFRLSVTIISSFLIIAGAAPQKYGDSKYWKTAQLNAANVYAADVGVPICIGKTSMGDVIAGAARSDGQDIVITNAGGTLISRELTSFSKTDSTFQLWYKDPATSATTGGTVVYIQWGGSTVNVADDATTWADCYGGSIDHALVIHGENTAANLTDASGNYTAADSNMAYASTGKILKAPEFNGGNTSINWGDITQVNAAQKATVMSWIKQDTIDRVDYIFFKNKDSNNRFGIFTSTNGYLYIEYTNDIKSYWDYSANISAGTFYLFTNVYDGSQTGNAAREVTYINKTVISKTYAGTIPATLSNPSGVNFLLGNRAGVANSFDGIIDEFRIVAGALTANQISCQYDIQNGFATNATLTMGTTRSFNTDNREVYFKNPYKKDDYKKAAYFKRRYF